MWTLPAWTPAAVDPMGESIIPSTMKMALSTSQHFCTDTEAPYSMPEAQLCSGLLYWAIHHELKAAYTLTRMYCSRFA